MVYHIVLSLYREERLRPHGERNSRTDIEPIRLIPNYSEVLLSALFVFFYRSILLFLSPWGLQSYTKQFTYGYRSFEKGYRAN